MNENLSTDIARFVWSRRYRFGRLERGVDDTWRRVATTVAATENAEAPKWESDYLEALRGFRFLPGGRILAGAGTGQQVTLFNCFVMGYIDDTLDGICKALKETALTTQQGGGIGCDFSTLRPRGSQAKEVGRIASGPVSFMHVWDAMCDTLASTSARGGAMMATLRCDHPDILEFVTAKREPGDLGCFNLSVQVTDEFMSAVRDRKEWSLVFPAAAVGGDGDTVQRHWSGHDGPTECRVLKRIPAAQLWDSIMRSAHETSEPGVIFVDTVNRLNNLHYRERITATNPCGEIPLPPYGACNLGSINLTRFVQAPFSRRATIDLQGIRDATRTAVRFLDSVIDISRYPLAEQRQVATGSRRIGLGVTGLADALILLGLHYDSEAARTQAAAVMAAICHSAYECSIELATEKGCFPLFEREPYLASEFIRGLPQGIRDGIARYGIRNSHLLAIAPAGTISVLAGNVSTGIEPVFDLTFRHRVRDEEKGERFFEVEDYALSRWRDLNADKPPPDYFVTSRELVPRAHIAMQAVLQRLVDNSISKTINVPEDCSFEALRDVYREAHEQGLKGCTIYRPAGGDAAPLQSSARQECGRCGEELSA